MGDLVVRGNFVFCLILVVIFIGLGRAYKGGRRRGDFGVIKWGASHKGMGPLLWGKLEVDPPRHHVKILIWQL